jgi:hypothetical protein
MMKHPWWFLDGFWWGKLSFVFRRVLGISLVCLVPLVPRFRWSRWFLFSVCFAGLRDPPPPQTSLSAFRLVVRYANHPVYAYANASAFSHASAYPSYASAYSHALAYAYACPKVIIELSRLFCLATYFVNSK